MPGRKRPLYGVGINDADYNVERRVGKKRVWICPYYRRWSNMLKRCYSSASLKERPTYARVSVSEDWLLFTNFKEWMEQQPWEDRQLDKDFLEGDKFIYSSDTCLFIPNALNNFIGKGKPKASNLPIGVGEKESYRKARYGSNIKNRYGETKYLGNFITPLEAHFAWIKAKISYCEEYLLEFSDEKDVVKGLTRIKTKLEYHLNNKIEFMNFY
ncbi:MAG: hypothetical protein [Caudoviricetes sp.]|nr:MAG: hypothetical protein [Caudoviricetes sp.]